MAALPERGQLEEISLPRLLMDVYAARFSGRIELRRDRVEKAFLFNQGIPIFTESNLPSESLGVQLMDSGAITRDDYAKVVERVNSLGCKEGAALLELRLVDPRGLFLALKEQVRRRIVQSFGWARGSFSLESGSKATPETHPFRADVYRLVQEGIETHWSADRVLADLEPNMKRFPTRTSRLARVQTRLASDDALEAFLAALDGKQSLWRVMQLANTPRAMAAVWVLDAAAVFEFRDVSAGDTQPFDLELELVVEEQANARASRDRAGGGVDAPQAPEPAAPTPEEREAAAAVSDATGKVLQDEIQQKFDALDSLDYYELLGVSQDAEMADIKAAYLYAAKTYHPDALARAHLDPAVRVQANKVFGMIGKAYGVLSNPDRRRAYDGSQGGDGGLDAERLANAETLYRKGEVLLRLGNFSGAIEFLAPAVDLWPEEAEYQSALGWALYKKMPSEPEKAKGHLEEAAELAPDDAIAIFRLSVVLRSLGETVAAATLLDRARKLDPKVK